MALFLRALLFVGGIFYVVMGVGFFIDPAGSGGGFGLSADGSLGLAAIRADITAFFVVAGGCLIWGGWAQKREPLLVTAALMSIAIIGRLYTLAIDGPHEAWWLPVIFEAVTVAVALLGIKVLVGNSSTQ